jgi:hypothetical protein
MQSVARELLAKDPQFAYHRPMDDMEERLVLETLLVRVLSEEGRKTAGLSPQAYAEAVRLRNQSFVEDVHAFVAELKQHRVAPAPEHPGSAATYSEFISSLPQQDELRALGTVYAKYQEILRREQRYDAQGVLWNAYVAAKDAGVSDRLALYRLVYYDDAQDMSALEAELLVRVLRADTELVLTYCPDTAVFRFRYALREPVISLSFLLSHVNGKPPEVVVEDLSSLAVAGTGCERGIQPRRLSPIAVGQRDDSREDLVTHLWACPDVRTERDAVASEIASLLEGKDGSAPRRPDEIAIITRTHAEALEFSVVLTELGIPVDDALGGPGTGAALIFLDYVFAFLEGGLEVLRTGQSGLDFERSLLVLVSLGADGADSVMRMMEVAETLREEGIPLVQPDPSGTTLAFAPGISGRCERLNHLNEALRRCRQGESTATVLAWLLGKFSLDRYLAEPYLSSAMRALGRVLQRISAAEQTVGRLRGRIDPATVRRRLRYLVGQGAHLDIASGVAVLPAHETRAREWPIVFLPRLNEHVFPADPHISALFRGATAQALKERAERLAESRRLGRGAFSFVGFAEDPHDSKEEEDRLFTLAATRATERLILAWSDRDGDREVSPSVYVRQAVARFCNQPLREIDWSIVTARFRHMVPPDAYWYPPTREGSIRPAVSEAPVFHLVSVTHSPYSLSTRWLCPRRYFYRHVLGLDREVTDAQTYGNLVHGILRALVLAPPEQLRAEIILRRPDIQEIIEHHHRRFSSESAFAFSMDRLRSALQDFLDKNPDFFRQRLLSVQGGPVVERKLERAAKREGKPVKLVGKVDVALHDLAGQVKVVDFKTGPPISVSALRRSMVYRESDVGKTQPPDRDYQLPLYRFLLAPNEPVLLSHFYLRPVHGGREGFKDVTIRVTDEAGLDEKTVTEAEMEGCVGEALKLAVDTEQAAGFPREPRNQACRRGLGECSFLFLCDGMEEE